MKKFQFLLFVILVSLFFIINVSAQQIHGKWFFAKEIDKKWYSDESTFFFIDTNNTWSFYGKNKVIEYGVYQFDGKQLSLYSVQGNFFPLQIDQNRLLFKNPASGILHELYQVLPGPKLELDQEAIDKPKTKTEQEKEDKEDPCEGLSFEDCMFKNGVIINTPNIWHGY